MNALRLQGLIFSVLAFATAAFSVFLAPMDLPQALWLATLLIVLIGIPHGALDPIFAKDLQQIKTRASWAGFVLGYLLLAALVVCLWWVSPTVFLIGFLGVSVLHFSGDLAPGATVLSRLLYGGSVITLPCLWHADEVGRLFSLMVGADAALPVAAGLHLIAWPWLAGLAVVVVRNRRRDWLLALEITAVGLLALTATPMVGFAVFFCGMHSMRHILRTQKYSGFTPQRLALVSVLPMLAVLLMASLGWTLLPELPADERVVRFLFVTLAALTVPHMVLVERVRFTGWQPRTV